MYSIEEDIENTRYRIRRLEDLIVKFRLGDYSLMPEIKQVVNDTDNHLQFTESIQECAAKVLQDYSDCYVHIDQDRYVYIIGRGEPSESCKKQYLDKLRDEIERNKNKIHLLSKSCSENKEERYEEYLKLKQEFEMSDKLEKEKQND